MIADMQESFNLRTKTQQLTVTFLNVSYGPVWNIGLIARTSGKLIIQPGNNLVLYKNEVAKWSPNTEKNYF